MRLRRHATWAAQEIVRIRLHSLVPVVKIERDHTAIADVTGVGK